MFVMSVCVCVCDIGDAHLCVYLLWDGVLLNPGMDLRQLLFLLLAEPGLEWLKHPKLLPVFCQHLSLVPAGEERQEDEGLIDILHIKDDAFFWILHMKRWDCLTFKDYDNVITQSNQQRAPVKLNFTFAF